MIPPAPRVVPRPAKVICDVCGHENPEANKACEKCEGPLSGSASPEPDAAAPHRASRDSQSAERKPWITLRLNASPRLLVLAAVLALLLGIWGWQEYKSRQASAAAPANTTSATEPASR